jgi:hypothetical protein
MKSPEVRALAYTATDLLLDNYDKASEVDCRKSDVDSAVSILEEPLNRFSSAKAAAGNSLLNAVEFPFRRL